MAMKIINANTWISVSLCKYLPSFKFIDDEKMLKIELAKIINSSIIFVFVMFK